MYDREDCSSNTVNSGSGTAQSKDAIIASVKDEVIREILQEFAFFCDIPHGSGNEKNLAAALLKRFEKNGYKAEIDDAGNLICEVPAFVGFEKVPLQIFQGHLDMVCAVSSTSDYEPQKDAVEWRITQKNGVEKECLCSDGNSSLGADCGIGNAVLLWLFCSLPNGNSNCRKHGPIRLIFTVGEEVGLVGAKKINPLLFDDVRYLINVDGFSANRIVTGSAGGRRETFNNTCVAIKTDEETEENYRAFEFTLTGFKGGHSGYDIDKGRVNAIKLLAAMLADMEFAGVDFKLSAFNGGESHNVIPSSASAVLIVKREDFLSCQRSMQKLMYELSANYGDTDWGGRFVFHEIAIPKYVMPYKEKSRLIHFLYGLCDGVISYNREKITADGNADVHVDLTSGGNADIHADLTAGGAAGLTAGGAAGENPGGNVDRYVDTSANVGKIICGMVEHDDEMKYEIQILVFIRSMSADYMEMIKKQNDEAAEACGFTLEFDEYAAWIPSKSAGLARLAADAYMEITNNKPDIKPVHVGLEPSIFSDYNPEMEMISIGAELQSPHSIHESVELDSIKTFALSLRNIIEKAAEKYI